MNTRRNDNNNNRELLSLLVSILLIWIIILLLMSLTYPQLALAQERQPAAPRQVAVVLVLDESSSLTATDPQGLRFTAARLFVSMLEEGDAVGVVFFATGSRTATDGMTVIRTAADKEALLDLLQPSAPEGWTDVSSAFAAASGLLAPVDRALYQPVVLLLTDGTPEVPEMASTYADDALDLAAALDAPVLSIGLTAAAQSAFLHRVAQATGGAVIPAGDASLLLDAYLTSFGEIKDRTLLGRGVAEAGKAYAVTVQEELTPYAERISFVLIGPAQVVDPDGTPVGPGPGVSLLVDEGFTVLTVERPRGGTWQVRTATDNPVQVRALLRSRLRILLDALGPLAEAGRPLLLAARLVEEQVDGSTVTVIGDAAFSARVERPDGRSESLDRLYDDGSHGDRLAGDGLFSRLYVNTDLPGVYTIAINGRKGGVPVELTGQVEAISLPALEPLGLDVPLYEVRDEAIPLGVHLADGGRLVGGRVIASVVTPAGQVEEIVLSVDGEGYRGSFLPTRSGDYRVTYAAQNAFYGGLPYDHTTDVTLRVRLVPRLILRSPGVDWGAVEAADAQAGLPLQVAVHNSGQEPVTVSFSLVDLSGFALTPDAPVALAPGLSALDLRLVADDGIPPGPFQGALRLAAPDDVDVAQREMALAGELYRPLVTAQAQPVVVACDGSLSLPVTIHAGSRHTETLELRLVGADGATLHAQQAAVGQGESSLLLSLPASLSTQSQAVDLLVQGREGLEIGPSGETGVQIAPSSLWVRCRRPLTAGGVGLVVLALGSVLIGQRIRRSKRPLIVTGTLLYRSRAAGEMAAAIDLTALAAPVLTLGRGPGCDLILPDPSLAEIHCLLRAERGRGRPQMILEPRAAVQRGYQSVSAPWPLQDGESFMMGSLTVQYVSDPTES